MNKQNDNRHHKTIISALENLAALIALYDSGAAKEIRKAKKRIPQEIADDLFFWGGAGSLMDQAIDVNRSDDRKAFELAAIELGKALIGAGANNLRMQNWINVFDSWAKRK